MRVVALGRRCGGYGGEVRSSDGPIDAIERVLRRDPQPSIDGAFREAERAIEEGADLVCLPGSSVAGDGETPPKAMLELSKRAVVVLETISSKTDSVRRAARAGKGLGPRRGWVLAGGEVIRGPITQLFVDTTDLRSPSERADRLGSLAEEIGRGTRTFRLTDGYLGLLLLCGEINALYSAGGVTATFTPEHWRGEETPEALARIWAALERVVVCNPTHTWMRPRAVEAKRRFLASKGAYLSPTNAYAASGQWSASNLAGVVLEHRQSARHPIVMGVAEAMRAADPPFAWAARAVDLGRGDKGARGEEG